MVAQVEVVKFGTFYKEGTRGSTGGAAQNDKVWGIAKVNGSLVTFWGRRNGKLKFKTMPGQAGKMKAENTWAEKTNPNRNGDVYMPVNREDMRNLFCPTLTDDLTSFFYSAMATGKLNTRH
jgi:hypothetical protein